MGSAQDPNISSTGFLLRSSVRTNLQKVSSNNFAYIFYDEQALPNYLE